MTIPFSIPDVKPLYFDTSQVDRDGFHKRLQTLLGVLHDRETRNIETEKLKREEALRLDQAAAGEQLAQMVRGLDTVPGMSIPTAGPMGGMGPTVQTKPVEGPLAQAFRPRPGTTVNFEAFKTGQNTISQYLNDRNERLKERAKPPEIRPEHDYVDANGFALVRPRGTGTAHHVLGPDGLPLRLRVPKADVEGDRWYLTGYEREGVPLEYNGRGEMRPVRAPAGMFKAGPITEAQDKAAGFYTESVEAWKTLKATGYRPIPKSFVDFVAGARRALGEDGSFEAYFVNSQVFDDDTKQAIISYILLGMNNIYKKSGAAITVKEMQQMIHRIPVEGESPKLTASKLRFFRSGIEAQFRTGYNALRRGEVEAQMPYQKPYEVFADEPGVDPQTQQPLIPGDPYQQRLQQGDGSMLRRPR